MTKRLLRAQGLAADFAAHYEPTVPCPFGRHFAAITEPRLRGNTLSIETSAEIEQLHYLPSYPPSPPATTAANLQYKPPTSLPGLQKLLSRPLQRIQRIVNFAAIQLCSYLCTRFGDLCRGFRASRGLIIDIQCFGPSPTRHSVQTYVKPTDREHHDLITHPPAPLSFRY